MLEAKLTITIEAPALTEALRRLSDAQLNSQLVSNFIAESAARDRAAAPVPAPSAPVHTELAPQESPAPAVPLSTAPSFTLEQVAKAGSDLLSARPEKMPELLALLEQYGVRAVAELPADRLGAFATALRGLGAKL